MNGEADFDADLFSPEELAMMREANGATNELTVKHDVSELQAQFTAVARLVAEGGERERQLRGLINDLTLLAKASQQQQHSIYTQTQTLAKIVISMSEREVELQQNLESLRGVVLGRAKQVT
jgi:hypothetical protein